MVGLQDLKYEVGWVTWNVYMKCIHDYMYLPPPYVSERSPSNDCWVPATVTVTFALYTSLQFNWVRKSVELSVVLTSFWTWDSLPTSSSTLGEVITQSTGMSDLHVQLTLIPRREPSSAWISSALIEYLLMAAKPLYLYSLTSLILATCYQVGWSCSFVSWPPKRVWWSQRYMGTPCILYSSVTSYRSD